MFSILRSAPVYVQHDLITTLPCAGGAEEKRSDQSGSSGKVSASNPSSTQQQFAFAAGLAAAADMPVASADPDDNSYPQANQPNSAAELDRMSSQRDQQLEQDSTQQSGSQFSHQSSYESLQGKDPQPQQDQQLDPWSEPYQSSRLSKQQGDRSQPAEGEKHETEPTLATSASANSNDGSTKSTNNGKATADDSDSVAEAEVVEIEQMSFHDRVQAGLDCFR